MRRASRSSVDKWAYRLSIALSRSFLVVDTTTAGPSSSEGMVETSGISLVCLVVMMVIISFVK